MNNYQIKIRWFSKSDISQKVKWINDSTVNQFLHYDLPLSEEKTLNWYNRVINDDKRADFTIEIELEEGRKIPVGLIGVIQIDRINQKAEFYIVMGEREYQGKGIAMKASRCFIDFCFQRFNLNRIYLYTEVANVSAQKLFEHLGFKKEGLLEDDLIYMGRKISRYVYGLKREEFNHGQSLSGHASDSVATIE
ncbi:MAG TPA: GNAT family protein [Bacillota bacterium]|nr:GNAT family protein [Bacillota bacterium]